MSENKELGIRITAQLDPAVKKSLGIMARDTKKAAKENKKAGRIVGSLGRTFKTNQKITDRLRTSTSRFQNSLKRTTRATGDLKREQDSLGRSIRNNERRMKRFAATRTRLQNSGQALSDLRGEAGGVIAGAVTAVAPIISAARNEEQEVRLRTVINSKDVDDAMKSSRDKARTMAKEGVSTIAESFQIQYALNSAGLNARTASAGSSVVAQVARVTAGDAESVGEVMATTFNNLGSTLQGTTEERFSRIGDLLTKTQLKFQIRNFHQLGESMKNAAGPMSAFKVPIEQGLTLLGQMNNAGTTGAEAGTAFRMIMNQMNKASQSLDFDMVRDSNGQLDLVTTLNNLDKSLQGMDTDERAVTLQNVFGDDASSPITLILGRLEMLEPAVKDVDEGSKGLVKDSYQYFEQSTSGQWRKLMSSFGTLADSIGRVLLPGVNAVIGPLSVMAGYVADLAEKYPELTTLMAGAAVTLMAFKTAVLAAKVATLLFGKSMKLTGANPTAQKASKSSWLSMKGMGGLLVATGALSIGSTLMDNQLSKKEKTQSIATDAGGITGALSGAAVGAALGSVVPIIGTTIGGIVGSIVGGMGGSWLGGKTGEWLVEENDNKTVSPDASAGPMQTLIERMHEKETLVQEKAAASAAPIKVEMGDIVLQQQQGERDEDFLVRTRSIIREEMERAAEKLRRQQERSLTDNTGGAYG
ncbi:MAG: phage tail tape measure protein [Endozoicomonas sp.]|uniref:phage tail tape measure protein n=1 Tax=Endozoicomonas sp. TaxID=1892382 RepID=UPI003D9BD5BD